VFGCQVFDVLCIVTQTKKKTMNVMLINQLAIDFYSSLMIIATYTVNLVDIYFSGTSGYLLCVMLSGQMLLWLGLCSSVVNLVVITLERYVKVVHSVWHKIHFKRWMAYFGCAFSWASGFLGTILPYLLTTYTYDGQCMALVRFSSRSGELIYIWFNYVYYYQIPVLLFVICYFRIFQVIRRQNRIFQQTSQDAAAIAASTVNDRKLSQSQLNAVKTMTSSTLFFAVSWLPINVSFVVMMTTTSTFIGPLWHITVFVALLNVCVNPFIYIVSYDDVRDYFFRNLTALLKVLRGQSVSNVSAVVTASELCR
jgi:hypothetical protein